MDKDISSKEIQLTIQGQTISSNFGIKESARFNIEQLLNVGVTLSLVALAVEKSCMSKYIEYTNRGREVAVLRAEMMTFHNFYMRCASLFMECKIASSEKHILLVNQLKADSIFRTNETFLRYRHLIYLYGGRVFIHLMLGDLEEVCKDQEKQYNSWLTVEKEMSQVHPEESLTLMSDYLYYLVIARKQKEYEEKVIELTPKMLAIKRNRLAKVVLVKLIYLINTNLDSNDILEYIDFIENYIISEYAASRLVSGASVVSSGSSTMSVTPPLPPSLDESLQPSSRVSRATPHTMANR